MQILDIYIQGFGKILDKRISFSEKINIIYGENEAGKSTIHNFIKAIFYGLERGKGRASKNDTWSKYEPWATSAYGGYIRLKKDDKIFRIERDFRKISKKPLSIIDEDKGIEIVDTDSCLSYILNGLSSLAYTNTISISQLKSVTDSGMSDELKKYISNMNSTGNEALDISKASNYLKVQKKFISKNYIEQANKNYEDNIIRLKNLEDKLELEKDNSQALNQAFKKDDKEILSDITQNQIEISLLNKYIDNNKALLESSEFTNISDLLAYKEQFNIKLKEYKKASENNNIKLLRIAIFILSFISIITAISSIYIFVSGQDNKLTHFLHIEYDLNISIFIILCTISTIILGVISRMLSSKCSKIKFLHNTLLLLVESLTGKKILDSDSIEKSNALLEKYEQCFENINAAKEKLLKLKINLDNLIKYQDDIKINIEKAQRKTWEIEKLYEQISNIEDENTALLKLIEENKKIDTEIKAIDLALETLKKLSINIKDSFGLYLNKEASFLIDKITKGKYNSISIDKDMNIFLNTVDKLVPIDSASSGTLDQIYLALRLAVAKLLQKNKQSLPLILDDSFVNYDEKRLSFSLEFLATNYSAQIIMFTCHRREIDILSSLQKIYNNINIT